MVVLISSFSLIFFRFIHLNNVSVSTPSALYDALLPFLQAECVFSRVAWGLEGISYYDAS
jgi:hypothetical protein